MPSSVPLSSRYVLCVLSGAVLCKSRECWKRSSVCIARDAPGMTPFLEERLWIMTNVVS